MLAGHGFGANVAATAAVALGPRCGGLVLVDGGWKSMEASTGVDVDEFLRGLDEPPEVMRSLPAFLADRSRFDPGSWDADRTERPATVLETHACRVVPATRPHALEACVRAMFTYDPVATLTAVDAPITALITADDDGSRAAALAALSASRQAAGHGSIEQVPFGHDGHNLMRYRPARWRRRSPPSTASAGKGATTSPDDEDAMQVVYSSNHLAHDIDTETYMGVGVPANEVAERAEKIRSALEADGGFTLTGPTEHGEDPITAVHDEGLLRFLETAWSEVRSQNIPRAFLSADTYPNRAMFDGMSPDAITRLVREPRHVGGRAGFWGLDSAAPLVAGMYAAARTAVDVALTTADLVLAGETVAMRSPATRPPRGPGDVRRLLLLQQRGDRRARDHAGHGERIAILDVDYHHGNGTQQIFWRRGDVRYVSIHADPDRQYPYFLGRADETGEGDGAGENLNIPLRAGATNDDYLEATDRAMEAIAGAGGSIVVVLLGFDTYGLDPIGDFALTTDVYHEVGPRVAALGRRLVILQEGGYHRPSLGENARAWLRRRRRARLRAPAGGRVRAGRCGDGLMPGSAVPRRTT